MGLNWTYWGVPGTLSLLVAWGLAAVVLRTAPDRALNRQLALLLVLEGLVRGTGTGLLFFMESSAAVFALGLICAVATGAIAFQYLAFLGASLASPLVAPFRTRRGRIALGVLATAAAIAPLLFPANFVAVYDPGWAAWNFQFTGVGEWLNRYYGLAPLFGLVAALSAYSRTRPGTAARSRAKWVAIAFGVRDCYFTVIQLAYPILRPIPFWGDVLFNPFQGLVSILFVALLAYGVLRLQVFDIHLKLRFALTQGVVAAGIASGFFIGSEVLDSVLDVDGLLPGLLVAALIVATLRPLQRWAERVATQLMGIDPGTPAYIEGRKLQVYRAALEGVLEDGTTTERERAVLRRLREELGISPEDAAALEHELAHRRPIAPFPA